MHFGVFRHNNERIQSPCVLIFHQKMTHLQDLEQRGKLNLLPLHLQWFSLLICCKTIIGALTKNKAWTFFRQQILNYYTIFLSWLETLANPSIFSSYLQSVPLGSKQTRLFFNCVTYFTSHIVKNAISEKNTFSPRELRSPFK
jgi:hypothetical protein